MRLLNKMRGVTLIELMIVIVITAILLSLATPAFQDAIDRNRLKAVTDTLYGDFQFAKAEAIKRNEQIVVDFTTSNGGATWCYGLKPSATSCNCNQTSVSAADACVIDNVLKVVKSTDYSNVSMTPSADLTFDNVRGTIERGTNSCTEGGTNACDVSLASTRAKQTKVLLKGLGKIRICSPSGTANVSGYSTSCP